MKELKQNVPYLKQCKVPFCSFCKAHWATMVIALLSVIVFVELAQVVSAPMAPQFCGDEYFSLEAAMKPTISELCRYSARQDGNGPIFNILLWFWYRIVPYGSRYLLMLPQIFMALSVLMTGLAAKKLLGSKGGVLAAVLLLINIDYMQYGNELRTYSLTCFATALMLWLYFHRLEIMGKEDTCFIVAYGLSMALLVYTHCCALFVCLLFFSSDMVLIIKNKIQKRTIFSYIIAAVIFLPWFIYFFKHSSLNLIARAPYPSVMGMFHMLKYLSCDNWAVTFICIAAIIFSVIMVLRRKVISTRLRAMFICSIGIVGFIVIMYATSVILVEYLHKGSFWVHRYFILQVPLLVFVISALFTEIVEQIKLKGHKQAIVSVLIIGTVLIFCLLHQYMQLKLNPTIHRNDAWLGSAVKPTPAYRRDDTWLGASANWLYEQPDIYESDTGVYCYHMPDSWRKYCLEQLGRRPKLHYVDVSDEKTLNGINKLYIVQLWSPIECSETFNKLKEKFEEIKIGGYCSVRAWRKRK
jgi:uncharacterized membrane protein